MFAIDNLKQQIKQRLKQKNLSIRALERAVSVHNSHIRNLIAENENNNQNPNIELIYNIAQELDCSIDDLVSDNQENTNSEYNVICNIKLYKKIFLYMIEIIKKTNPPSLELGNLEYIINESYLFCSKKGKFDHEFVEWLVKLKLNNT